ncbi:MAG: DUF4214 domain-containing protein [Sulfitobacter sp.]
MSISAAEQLLIEMINRARLDPEAEAERFGIDLNEGLEAGTLDGSARQVLAPNELLNAAADAHGTWILETNTFSHTGANGSSPHERIEAAGYEFTGAYASGENLSYRGTTGTLDLDALMENNHHEDLFLSAGHRVNMLHDFYSEIGVSQLAGTFTSGTTEFNASVVVENFAVSGSSVFLTGVSYTDSDDDDFYSIGEGRSGVAVQADGSTTTTAAAGGYALELVASAAVAVSLGGFTVTVDLSEGNGKLDLVNADDILTSVDTTLTSAVGSLTALGVGDITLTGHDGADVLVGNKGDNVLDGGAGNDTVRYDLTRAEVTLNRLEDGSVEAVSEMGTDTLIGIETVMFSDEAITSKTLSATVLSAESTDYFGDILAGTDGDDGLYAGGFSVGLAADESAQVFRLYQAALDRVPDTGGHASWTEALFEGASTLSEVAAGFVASTEFQTTYGDLDTGDFVDLLYQNVLGRAADAGGRATWVARIDEEGLSRADAVTGFSESAELIAATSAASNSFTQSRTESEWSDDVYRLYVATLDRDPDLTGFEGWLGDLAAGADFTDVVTGFVASPEFSATYGDLNDADFIDLLYNNVLDRDPDDAGEQGWLDAIAAGQSREEVVQAFVQSDEFKASTAQPLQDWVAAQGVQDVIIGGAGDDVLAGGALSDVFIFDAAAEGGNTVLDFEAWDVVQFEGFGYDAAADVQEHLSAAGDDLVFSDQGVTVTFLDTAVINDDMINI